MDGIVHRGMSDLARSIVQGARLSPRELDAIAWSYGEGRRGRSLDPRNILSNACPTIHGRLVGLVSQIDEETGFLEGKTPWIIERNEGLVRPIALNLLRAFGATSEEFIEERLAPFPFQVRSGVDITNIESPFQHSHHGDYAAIVHTYKIKDSKTGLRYLVVRGKIPPSIAEKAGRYNHRFDSLRHDLFSEMLKLWDTYGFTLVTETEEDACAWEERLKAMGEDPHSPFCFFASENLYKEGRGGGGRTKGYGSIHVDGLVQYFLFEDGERLEINVPLEGHIVTLRDRMINQGVGEFANDPRAHHIFSLGNNAKPHNLGYSEGKVLVIVDHYRGPEDIKAGRILSPKDFRVGRYNLLVGGGVNTLNAVQGDPLEYFVLKEVA